MAESEETERTHEQIQGQIKIDPVRTIPATALLRALPGNQTRFMMATPVQASSAVICTASSSTPVILPPQAASSQASQHHHIQTIAKPVTRISTVPVQTGPTTSYHVPRGAAAVANIAAPRSASVATPIIRAPTNIQNITQPHSMNVSTGGSIVGRNIVGVQTGYVGVPTTVPAPTVSIVPRHTTKIPASQVGTRLTAVSSHIRPTDSRPVVLQTTTTHKQVTLTHQLSDKSSCTAQAVVKSFSGARMGTTNRGSGLPPTMLPLGSGQNAVLVGPAKTSTPARVIGQPAPTAAAIHQQSTIISSAVITRPVMLGSSNATVVRSGVTQQAKIYQPSDSQQPQQNISQPIFIQHKPQIVSGGMYSVQQPAGGAIVSTVAGGGTMVTVGGSAVPAVVHTANPPHAISSGGHTMTVHTTHTISSGHSVAVHPPPAQTVTAQGVTVHAAPHTPAVSGHSIAVHSTPQIVSTTVAHTIVTTSHSTPSSQPQFVEARQIVQQGASRPPTPSLPLSHQQGLVTTSSQQMRFKPVMVVEPSRTPSQNYSLPTTTSSEVVNEGQTNMLVTGLTTPTGLTQTLASKQNTSPRPSILRKRDPEGLMMLSSWSPLKAQKNLMPLLSNLSVTTTPGGSGEDEGTNNPAAGSGGSSTLSAASSPGDDTAPVLALATNRSTPPPIHEESQPPSQEVSPRKKPRKQQLPHNNQTSELSQFSDDEMEFISQENAQMQPKIDYNEDQEKRKRMSLWKSSKPSWKSPNNHFMRYTDIKAKEEKKPTLSELANQKNALHKINGWKIYHLLSQIEDMVNSENEYHELYSSLLSGVEGRQQKVKTKDHNKNEEIMNMINERIKANAVRCKVVKDHMEEAKSQIMKLFDHKSYVADLINRCANKRSMKKRERL